MQRDRLAACWLPRQHLRAAMDALAVLRACTHVSTEWRGSGGTDFQPARGAGLPAAVRLPLHLAAGCVGVDEVAALLGQHEDTRRHLDLVHWAWGHRDMVDTPVLDVRCEQVPDQHELTAIESWSGSRPIWIGNLARHQRLRYLALRYIDMLRRRPPVPVPRYGDISGL